MNGSGGAALAISIMAQQQAREAQLTACRSLVVKYEHEGATIGTRQAYAECINLLHPQSFPISGPEAMILKTIIAVAILLVPAGAIYGWREDRTAPNAILFGFLAPVMWILAVFFVALVLAGGAYVLGVQ